MKKMTSHYFYLFLMVLLSFISMYILMYMMVDKFANVYNNLNQLYMAAIMTGPMIIIELLLMHSMYPNKALNIFIIVFTTIFFIIFIWCIRNQTAISDKEFLKSMIPHHGGAVLMCSEAPIADPEIQKLCQTIISSQQSEIDWMKKKLKNISHEKY